MKNNISRFLVITTLFTFAGVGRAIALDPHTMELEASLLNETIELAQARENDRRWGAKKEGQSRLIEELNLTQEQRQQMQQIKNRYEPQMTSLRQQIRNERRTLQTMMDNNESADAIRVQNQTISDLTQQMRNLGFETMLEMREVLNAEQREQLTQLMRERRSSNRQNR